VGLSCLAVGLAGCAGAGGGASGGGAGGVSGARGVSGTAPFAADRAVISGLTHFDRTAGGAWELVLHLELVDAYGDRVKSVGRLSARLFLGATERVSWDLDLRDPETNSSYFDPATGTYRVRLSGLPDGVVAFASGRGSDPEATLGVSFATADEGGEAVVLRDEFRLTPAR